MRFDPISLRPAKVKRAEKRHAQNTRTFQGIPSIERIPSGRLFAVWYSGGTGNRLSAVPIRFKHNKGE